MRHNNEILCDIIPKGGMIDSLRSTVVFALLFFSFTLLLPVSSIADNKDKGKLKDTPKVEKKAEMKKETSTGGEKKKGGGIPGVTEKDYDEEDFKPRVEEESYAWMVFKTIIILGAIVGMFYYFFKFVTKKAGIQVQGRDVLKILSIVPICLLYTSPSPRDVEESRMPSSA